MNWRVSSVDGLTLSDSPVFAGRAAPSSMALDRARVSRSWPAPARCASAKTRSGGMPSKEGKRDNAS